MWWVRLTVKDVNKDPKVQTKFWVNLALVTHLYPMNDGNGTSITLGPGDTDFIIVAESQEEILSQALRDQSPNVVVQMPDSNDLVNQELRIIAQEEREKF